MTAEATTRTGSIAAIWRYPIKSMIGEELDTTAVAERGLWGDRAFALVDSESGKIISAKNPRKWGDLFAFQSDLPEGTHQAGPLPAARITFPDGSRATSADADIDKRLSDRLSRRVRLAAAAPPSARAEGYWPDHDWLEQPDETFEFELPEGTFFDCAPVHLVTMATFDRLRELAPKSQFDVARFRPNFVIECGGSPAGFIENEWVGRTILIGSEVRVLAVRPAARCVMTTLAQGLLPKDPDVLRTAVQNNQGNVGVYATVVRGGTVRRGDAVAIA
jgi:uncharacterized protein YcbX